MMSFDELCDAATELAEALIEDAQEVTAAQIGLDQRSFFKGWATEDCLIVHKSEDNALQYYGGFEYVAKEYRLELGAYVVYSAENNRVREALDLLKEPEDVEPTAEDIAASKADLYNDMRKCDDVE